MDTRLEGNHLTVLDFVPVLAGHGIAEVGIGRRIPVTGEMFEATQHAVLLEGLQIGLDHRGGRGGIRRERARADDDVTGVGIDIRHGGEVDVKAILGQIGADRIGGLRHFFGLAGGCQLRHVGEFG